MDEETFKKNLGLGNEIEVVTPDGIGKITLFPLSIQYLPDILAVQAALSESNGDEAAMTKILGREDVSKRMAKLIEASLRESLPDKDEKYINFVAMKNFLMLMTEIFRINDLGVSGIDAVKERLNRLKEARAGGKSTNPK